MKTSSVVFLTFALTFCSTTFAQISSDSVFNRTDSYVADIMKSNGIIGLNYAILKEGEIVHKKTMGIANIEYQTPMKIDNLFAIASISKLFSAMALHKLLYKHQRTVDETVNDFLPNRLDLPITWQNLTVKQLLSHTSGIPDQIDYKIYLAPESDEFIINSMKDKSFSSEPGKESKYNATGYFLIRLIIEELSGEKFENHMKNKYFDKLKLKSANYGGFKKIVPNRVTNYTNVDGNLELLPLNYSSSMYAAAGVNITIDDLILWFQHVLKGTIVPLKKLQKIWTPVKLSNGKSGYFGLGWEVFSEGNSINAVGHGGAGISSLRHFYGKGLKESITVILLTNGAKEWKQRPNTISANIANIILSDTK